MYSISNKKATNLKWSPASYY